MSEPADLQQGLVPTPDGTQLCVYRLGEGDAAVIVPNAIYLLEHFAWLARSYTLIAYDLRNRGRSAPVTDRAQLHRGVHHDVEDLETVRRYFKLERPHMIGHSYLGLMVILYAVTNPERVGRLVQIGPAPPVHGTRYPAPLTSPDLEELASSEGARRLQQLREEGRPASDPQGFCGHWWAFMRTVFVADPAKVDRIGDHYCEFENEWPVNMESHLTRNIFPSLERLQLSDEQIGAVESPVLTVHGKLDRNSPYGAGRDWAARLPNARLLTIDDAAHLPYLESPSRVMPAIDQFLGGTWPAGAEQIGEA